MINKITKKLLFEESRIYVYKYNYNVKDWFRIFCVPYKK